MNTLKAPFRRFQRHQGRWLKAERAAGTTHTHPVPDVEKALSVGQVEHQQETHGISEEGCCEAAEPENQSHGKCSPFNTWYHLVSRGMGLWVFYHSPSLIHTVPVEAACLLYLSCPAVSQSCRWILKFRSVIPSTPVPVYIWTKALAAPLISKGGHTEHLGFAWLQPHHHSPLVFLWSRCPRWSWTCGWTCCRCTCGGRWSFPLRSPPAPEAWSSNHNPSQPLCHCVLHLSQFNMCWICVLKNLQWEVTGRPSKKISFW